MPTTPRRRSRCVCVVTLDHHRSATYDYVPRTRPPKSKPLAFALPSQMPSRAPAPALARSEMIKAITGHRSDSALAPYIRKANKAKLAREAKAMVRADRKLERGVG
jgi:hypothetical protein